MWLLDYSAVEFLVKNGVRVVGIDYLSIEAFDTKDNVWRDSYKGFVEFQKDCSKQDRKETNR